MEYKEWVKGWVMDICNRNGWKIEGRLQRRKDIETRYGASGLMGYGEGRIYEDEGYNLYSLCTSFLSDYRGLLTVVTADETIIDFQ